MVAMETFASDCICMLGVREMRGEMRMVEELDGVWEDVGMTLDSEERETMVWRSEWTIAKTGTTMLVGMEGSMVGVKMVSGAEEGERSARGESSCLAA
jgi:hypothetical protein